MSLELTLLILESVLLVATVILLIYSIREGRQRDALLLGVERATRILTRQEYFLAVTDAMMEAKEEVVGYITGRPPAGEDTKRTRDIVYNIERLSKAGVSVRYLLPKFPDRLHVGQLYTRAGAEVRFGICLMVSEIRYIVVDGRTVVIGVPESIGEKEATKKGYRIPSEGLAFILSEYFTKCWDKGATYEDYIREVLRETGVSPRVLASELKMEESELLRIKKHNET
jgi:hypothetical protein